MTAAMASFFRRPVVRAALTSGGVMTCGDVLCQSIQRKQFQPAQVDWQRAARFGVVGLTLHGPFFFCGFRALDARMGTAQALQSAVAKTAVGQVTLFPVYVAALYAYLGALEGLDAPACLSKVQACFPATFMTGSVFWPVANVINFRFVPGSHRVLYINACGLVWNSYLSWTNTREGAVAPTIEAAAS